MVYKSGGTKNATPKNRVQAQEKKDAQIKEPPSWT